MLTRGIDDGTTRHNTQHTSTTKGVLLWELWERKEPFEGDDELTVAFKVAQDKQTLPISPSCPEV